jgi:hypothetical protein
MARLELHALGQDSLVTGEVVAVAQEVQAHRMYLQVVTVVLAEYLLVAVVAVVKLVTHTTLVVRLEQVEQVGEEKL